MSHQKAVKARPKPKAPVLDERRSRFVKALAEYLAGNQAGKSIALEMAARVPPIIPWAKEWAEVRSASPLMGYPTVAEAEKELVRFLFGLE